MYNAFQIKPKNLPEFYLSVAQNLRDASVKLGMRSVLGYAQTAEERKALVEIQEIFFPDADSPEEVQKNVLIKASHVLIDAWAGVPVEYLPPVSRLKTVNHTANELKYLPMRLPTRRIEEK